MSSELAHSETQRRRLLGALRGQLLQNGLVVLIVLVAAVFALLSPAFLTGANMIVIVATVAAVGIMAVMSTGVVITGGFDLSVGSVTALSGLVMASTASALAPDQWPLAVVAGLAVGVAVGAANGLMVVWLPVPPFVVTLGTMFIVRGVAVLYGTGQIYSIPGPPELLYIGQGKVGPVPFQAVLFLALAAFLVLIERQTVLGRLTYLVGANDTASGLMGLPRRRARCTTYVISGLGGALAGIVISTQVSSAASYYGEGLELDVITAILLGGTSMFGGEGSALKSVLGALLVGEIANGLGVLNVNADAQLVVRGLLLVLAVLFDRALRRMRRAA